MPRHRIVALWCHPRSMSTAMERLMRERGDMTVLHEPFMYDYYLHRQVRQFPHFEPEPDRPRSYEEIRVWILDEAEKAPVFFKDMAFCVRHRLPDDPEFARATTHAFLVRDPARSIPSYWKIDPELTEEEVGIAAQEALRERLAQLLGAAPPVVRAEDVQRDRKASSAVSGRGSACRRLRTPSPGGRDRRRIGSRLPAGTSASAPPAVSRSRATAKARGSARSPPSRGLPGSVPRTSPPTTGWRRRR